jgi:hypothetical protein
MVRAGHGAAWIGAFLRRSGSERDRAGVDEKINQK